MVKIDFSGNMLEGIFLKRINRFSAVVEIDNKVEQVYVANSGRMKELLLKGSKALLSKQKGDTRKTKFDLVAVWKEDVLVSIDSRVPNLILYEAFISQQLYPFKGLVDIKKEAVIGKSRLDFLLKYPESNCYVEAKSVTLVENKIARFPDAPTLRGSKHILELINLVQQGNRGAIVFIIQRNDAESFEPNYKTDLDFAQNLKFAKEAGVEVYAFVCNCTKDYIAIDKEIKVTL